MLEILFGWRKASKCKDLIKCVRCRLKLLRSKRDAIIRQLRSDVAQLLKNGQDESAFARVEQLFKDQNMLAAYDLLDNFCEFIILNLPYIRRHRDFPNDINEAISSLIFTSARCADLPELLMLRKLFGKRYGKDFAVAAVELFPGNHVNQQIMEKLCVRSISDDAKLRLIEEIAKEYNIKIECPEVEDTLNPLQCQKVYDPSLQNGDCGLEKQVSEKDIQVIFSDMGGAKMQASNGKETLQMYQERHIGHANHLQEKARYDSLSNCEKMVQSPCRSHDCSGINSNSIGASVVRECASDIVQPLNSPKIGASMEKLDNIHKLDPSYERIFIYSDDAQDLHHSMQDYNEGDDERPLKPTNSLQKNKRRKQCEVKHAPKNRSHRPKIKIGNTGSHEEGKQENGHIYCESPSRASRASLSDLHHYNCARKLEDFGELHDESVSSRCCCKRRKSVSTRSRERLISTQSELYGGCVDTHELGDFHGTSPRLSREIHHQRDCSSMSTALSMKDMEYSLYYDESCGDSVVDFLDSKQKHSHFHRIKPDGDYLSREHHHRHSMSYFAEDLYMRSELCRKKHQKETMSGSRKKHMSPQRYYEWKTSGDISFEVLLNSRAFHRHKCCRRRSCSSCSWNNDKVHDCSLEHPCYFFASENKNDWESQSPNQSCVTTIAESPSRNIQQQKQEDDFHSRCYPHNHEFNSIATACHQGTTSLETEATSARRCVDLNSDINIGNDSACDVIAFQSLRLREYKEEKKEASDHCDNYSSSHVSYSSEILPPSSGSWTKTHPPYLRAMTMPLPERPKIKLPSETPRSSSLKFQQPIRHVHPKLPDYDDLTAKFMELKKEHSRNSTPRASNA